jgi:hypothetical protein
MTNDGPIKISKQANETKFDCDFVTVRPDAGQRLPIKTEHISAAAGGWYIVQPFEVRQLSDYYSLL